MIKLEEVLEIIKTDNLLPVQKLEIISFYIKDVKGVDTKINTPDNLLRHQLMELAYGAAKEYYLNKEANEGHIS